MSQQLIDNGAVIGYRPKLEYTKPIKQNTASISGSPTDASGTVQYSSPLNGLSNSLPSTTIGDVDYVVDSIKSLMAGLAAKFPSGTLKEHGSISTLMNAIAINDVESIDAFISAHKTNINGSIIPELIGHLYTTSTRMQLLRDTLKELYYGSKNVTQEEIEAMDANNVAKLKALEVAGDAHKINYVAVSYDAMLNRSISAEVFAVNKQAIGMSKIPNSATHLTDDEANKEFVAQLYSDVNKDLDYRQEAFEIQQTVEILEKTLYNYYNSRNDYIALYNIYNGQEAFSMTHRLSDYQYRVKRSLENVIRTLGGNQHYLSQMTTLEQEKNNLMSNYSKLSCKT